MQKCVVCDAKWTSAVHRSFLLNMKRTTTCVNGLEFALTLTLLGGAHQYRPIFISIGVSHSNHLTRTIASSHLHWFFLPSTLFFIRNYFSTQKSRNTWQTVLFSVNFRTKVFSFVKNFVLRCFLYTFFSHRVIFLYAILLEHRTVWRFVSVIQCAIRGIAEFFLLRWIEKFAYEAMQALGDPCPESDQVKKNPSILCLFPTFPDFSRYDSFWYDLLCDLYNSTLNTIVFVEHFSDNQ